MDPYAAGGETTLPKLVHVVRHCWPEGQEPAAPLTPEGRVQAAALADFLVEASRADGVRIERIISSPFARAQQSAAPLAARVGIAIETDARLRERSLTTASRSDWRDLVRASFDDLDLRLEGGESNRTAMHRAAAVLEGIRRHPAQTTALVTHGNLLTLLLKCLDGRVGFDEWGRLTYPDVFRVALRDGGPQVARIWR